MKNLIIGLSLAIAAVLLAGCAMPRRDYNNNIAVGAYGGALHIAEKEAAKKNKDELLWHLQAGAAASYAGNAEECIRHLDLAEDIFQKNDLKSVFDKGVDNTSSMLVNDLVYDYNGMGLDRTFCCLYKAIDFAVLGKMNSARMEFNRAAQHQENWVQERKKDVEASYNKLSKDGEKESKKKNVSKECSMQKVEGVASDSRFVNLLKEKTGFDYSACGNLEQLAAYDYTSIYLAHLCGVFRWLNNDGGRNFLKDAATLAPQNTLLAEDFKNADKGRNPDRNVWIYVEDGLCCNRVDLSINFPTVLLPYVGNYVLAVSMAFPLLVERLPAAEQYFVETSGGTSQMLFLESIDRLVRTEYGVFMRTAVPREIMRILIRTASQAALGIAADNTRNSSARLILFFSQLGVGIYGMAVSSSDTRSWEALPKNVYVQRVPSPADGKLRIKAGNMQTVELDVPADCGGIVWLRRPTVHAAPSVKTIFFKGQ